jgi:hypothetical protein
METFCTARLDPARRSVESRDFETELRCKIVGHPIDVLEGSGRSADANGDAGARTAERSSRRQRWPRDSVGRDDGSRRATANSHTRKTNAQLVSTGRG